MITDNFSPPAAGARSSWRSARPLEIAAAALLGLALLAALVFGTAQPAAAQGLAVEIHKGRLVRLPVPAASVFIANPAIADIQVKSPRLIYLFGKAVGETTLIAIAGNDRVVLNRRISVTHNLSRLRATINSLMPGHSVRVSSTDGGVVLSGTVNTPAQANTLVQLAGRFAGKPENVTSQLKVVGPTQVTLRVKVMEVSRSITRRIGINWDAAIWKSAGMAIGLFTGTPTMPLPVQFPLPGTFTSRTDGTNSILGSYQKLGRVNFAAQSIIDLLEDRGLIRVLAEPSLTAMSGKSASFLAGGEFPIATQTSNGEVNVEFKKFGVSLGFTPVILNGTRIHLKVEPEVSQLSNVGAVTLAGITIPALQVRRAATTVELASGQSFVIAGLLQGASTKNLGKVPGLGNLPVLGKLFQSERFQKNETELVILVTPYIVRPIGSKTAATRVRVVAPHTDARRLILGRKGKSTPGAPTKLHGNVGFVLE